MAHPGQLLLHVLDYYHLLWRWGQTKCIKPEIDMSVCSSGSVPDARFVGLWLMW